MKNKSRFLLLLAVVLTLVSQAQKKDTLCFIQVNDIYEIAPLQGGKSGGIARIASFIDECKKRYPTYTFVAGDFLSPSVMGTAVVDNERLSGKQMIDGLNEIGIDYVTFGNHEFDIGESALQKRINESKFTWFSSNVFRNDGTPFYKEEAGNKFPFPEYVSITSPKKQFTVHLIGLTLPSNTPAYSKFIAYDEAIDKWLPLLNVKDAAVMGLTHLSAKEDLEILSKHHDIHFIMGGHEHEDMYLSSARGSHVAKADANGKSIYKHLVYRDEKKNITVKSELINMDEAIPLKASTTALVKKWEDAVYNSFRKSGLEPTRDVCRLTDTLKGMEASIRYEQNNLGKIINETLMMDSQADASFINAGAIRIDDNVTGSITELDVIRIMPFGNKIVEVQMKGGLLEQMIKSNDERKGLGGYLQIGKEVGVSNGIVTVNGKSVDKDKVYKIRTIEFLVSGKELRLEMFNEKNPDILTVSQSKDNNGNALDLRLAFIQMLKKVYTNR